MRNYPYSVSALTSSGTQVSQNLVIGSSKIRRVLGKNTLISGRVHIFLFTSYCSLSPHTYLSSNLTPNPNSKKISSSHQISRPEMGSQNTSSPPSLQFSGGLSSARRTGFWNLTLSFSSVGVAFIGKTLVSRLQLSRSLSWPRDVSAMGQTGFKGSFVWSRVFFLFGKKTVIGVLYASQMVRSSVRARVSFHHLDICSGYMGDVLLLMLSWFEG